MSMEVATRSHPLAGRPVPRRAGEPLPRSAGRAPALLFGVWLGCAATVANAAPAAVVPAAEPAAEAAELSEPMRIAIVLAKAAGGGVGFVGATLSLDEKASPAEAAIIQPVAIEKMRTGEILMLVQDGCRMPAGCLMARKIVEKRGSDVATQRYGRPMAEGGKGVDASVVGRIAYVVNLETGRIRDMRHDDTKEISLVEALRREAKKWHYVGTTVRPRPLSI
jgi:hypothetical protein